MLLTSASINCVQSKLLIFSNMISTVFWYTSSYSFLEVFCQSGSRHFEFGCNSGKLSALLNKYKEQFNLI